MGGFWLWAVILVVAGVLFAWWVKFALRRYGGGLLGPDGSYRADGGEIPPNFEKGVSVMMAGSLPDIGVVECRCGCEVFEVSISSLGVVLTCERCVERIDLRIRVTVGIERVLGFDPERKE